MCIDKVKSHSTFRTGEMQIPEILLFCHNHTANRNLVLLTFILAVQPYSIRCAAVSDLSDLEKIEKESWDSKMVHTRELILERLKNSPMNNYVLELEGNVIAAIYSQRIDSVESLMNGKVTWTNEDSLREPLGDVLQLFRVNTLRQSKAASEGIPAGYILRDFCLAFAKRLKLKSVCAVTRTQKFAPEISPYEDYVNQSVSRGHHPDPGLNFHTSRGAAILKAIPDWREEDDANQSYGVLVEYTIDIKAAVSKFVTNRVQSLSEWDLPSFNPTKPLLSMGLDSLSAIELIHSVNREFDIKLSETAVFSFPTTDALAIFFTDFSFLQSSIPLNII